MNKEEIFKEVLSVYKKREQKKFKEHHERPEYYAGYNLVCEWRERILIHTESQGFPHELFFHRSPNMTDKEFEYVKKNFKRITLPIFIDYLSVVSRATIDSNWTIHFADDKEIYKVDGYSNTLREYLDEIKLEQYWKEIIPSIKTKDANGVICVKPSFAYELDENGAYRLDSEKNPIMDETVLPMPMPYYYCCERVVAHEVDKYVMVLTDEKSEVTSGGRTVKEGLVFEYYDRKTIWKIFQVGDKVLMKFEWGLIYQHDSDFLPAKVLGGVPNILENGNKVIYQSPYLFSTDILDLVLLNSSNLQVSINNCVYPYRVMVGYPCGFEDAKGKCDEGNFLNLLNGEVLGSCPKCNGSGLKDRVSPSGVLLLNPKERNSDGELGGGKNHLYYVSPETHTLEFLESKIEKDETKAKSILHLQTSNSKTKGTEDMTATGMALDQKSMYSFIKNISDQLFGIYEFLIDAIGMERYGADYQKPTITLPVVFDFKTEEDYMFELGLAIKNGMPPFVLHTIVYKFIESYFYSDREKADVFKLVMLSDRIFTMNSGDIIVGLNNGTIEKWESILHDSAISFVKELVMDNEKFFEQEIEMQQEQLIDKAKIRAEQIQQTQKVVDEDILKTIVNA